MAIRGFIIAIEEYGPPLHGLPKVVEQAAEFRNWLIEKKGVDPANIYACASGVPGWETSGTESGDIIKELKRLKRDGKNKTEEIYFYFSGHGFSLPITPDKNIDILVCSDFDGEDSGRACISLEEVKEKLYRSLGPGNHYYFIDACRNEVQDIQVALSGLNTDVSELGSPTVYRLFSTAPGAIAKTSSEFSAILVDGLKGKGTAKDWKEERLWVLFDRLCEFVQSQIKNQDVLYSKEGTDVGKILEIVPIPEVYCQIKIRNAGDTDTFEISIDNVWSNVKKERFNGSHYNISLRPGNYSISLTPYPPDNSEIIRIEPSPASRTLSLYDSCEISFEKKDGVDDFELTDDFPIADWRDGEAHSSEEIVDSETTPTPEILEYILSRASEFVRTEILQNVESFNSGISLGLLLSLFGASQIIFSPEKQTEFFNMQPHDFRSLEIDKSEIYILAGFEKQRGEFEIAVEYGDGATWQAVPQIDGIEGLFGKRWPSASGMNLISLRISGKPSLTYPVYSLPNRVTLFVMTEDPDGRVGVHQFILPVEHLFAFLDPMVLEHMSYNPLKIIKYIFRAQVQFALKQQIIDNTKSPDELNSTERFWKDLIYGKWLDPVMSLIGAYELIRSGQTELNKILLRQMLSNLRNYFPGLPDTEAIAKMIGEKWTAPQGVPLILDGLLAFDVETEIISPVPLNKIDFGSVWTRWYGVF